MIANIETFFDFENSKEYISSYSLEKVDDNKIRIKTAYPRKQKLENFLKVVVMFLIFMSG